MGHCFVSALFYFPQIQDGGQAGERIRGNVSTFSVSTFWAIRLLTTVYAKNRYQDHIWYDESENHPLDEQRKI